MHKLRNYDNMTLHLNKQSYSDEYDTLSVGYIDFVDIKKNKIEKHYVTGQLNSPLRLVEFNCRLYRQVIFSSFSPHIITKIRKNYKSGILL